MGPSTENRPEINRGHQPFGFVDKLPANCSGRDYPMPLTTGPSAHITGRMSRSVALKITACAVAEQHDVIGVNPR